MGSKNHKIGEIEFSKSGWSRTSEDFFPKYFPNVWFVSIPLLRDKKDMKSGETITTALGFGDKWDAIAFSKFLKGHMKKYIKLKMSHKLHNEKRRIH